MKNVVLLLVLLFVPTLAQNTVLAGSGPYSLRQSDVTPALDLLEFLAQSPLTQQEKQAIIQEATSDFYDDPQTGVALTRPDLKASVGYFQQMSAMKGESISQQQLALLEQEVINNFPQLDGDTQRLLASGTILGNLLQANVQTRNPSQQNTMKSHYRTTTGGPPVRTRGPAPTDQSEAFQELAQSGLRNNDMLLESLREAGGSTDYWSVTKSR